jgi:hypothetical protein
MAMLSKYQLKNVSILMKVSYFTTIIYLRHVRHFNSLSYCLILIIALHLKKAIGLRPKKKQIFAIFRVSKSYLKKCNAIMHMIPGVWLMNVQTQFLRIMLFTVEKIFFS